MRKLFFSAIIATSLLVACHANPKETKSEVENDTTAVATDSHTSEKSLDWAGNYEGTLPCADCEGIKTQVSLNADSTFTTVSTYLGKKGKSFTTKGKFTWDTTGSNITLTDEAKEVTEYKVGENKIIMLDKEGKEATGKMAKYYVLEKK